MGLARNLQVDNRPELRQFRLALTSSSSSEACPVPPFVALAEAAGAVSARSGPPPARLRGPRVGQAGARRRRLILLTVARLVYLEADRRAA
jgi:hypothetical protein